MTQAPIGRRRFLAISAAMAATPALARPHTWTGHALGAEVSVKLDMPGDPAALIAEITAELDAIENAFSLYRASSEITTLNKIATLPLTDHWQRLLPVVDRVHANTGGLFDPTVQSLWIALAKGHDPARATARIGWHKASSRPNRLTLAPGQKLTLNGIAQGYATDRIRALLHGAGLTHSLINIGEFSALGGPYRLGLSDPAHGHIGTVTLNNAAVATSSPQGTQIGASGHILHPTARAQWSTVSIIADTATEADAYSTALTLAPLDQVRAIKAATPALRKITLVAENGDVTTV